MRASVPPAAHAPRTSSATVADVDAISALESRCFPACDRFRRGTWRHLLSAAVANRSSITLLVRDGTSVIGAINGLLRRDSALLRMYSLAVDPDARGLGLGKQLIAALIAAAPPRCTTLTLEVRSDNQAARRLYENIGCHEYAYLSAYYPDGGDGVRYRADLIAVRERLASTFQKR